MVKVKEILKRITLRRLIVLIILLIFNSYAWFLYNTRILGSLTTRVVAWKVTFKYEDEEVVNSVPLFIDIIYPGMDEVKFEVETYNLGEKNAIVYFEIRELRILDEVFKVGELDEEEEKYTPQRLYDMLTDGTYPFDFEIKIENDGDMEAETGKCTITIYFNWEFELDDEEFDEQEIKDKNKLDTKYGELAYEFNKENPDIPSIEMKINIIASQTIN